MEKSKKEYFRLPVEACFKDLETRSEGLTNDEVSQRLETYGKNALEEGHKPTLFAKFLEQFKDLMIIILLVAAVISGIFGDVSDTFIILAVVLLNAVIGVVQEYKAEKALEALKNMSLPFAKVRRNGVVVSIKSEDIVPGDVVILDAGDFVPADLRLSTISSLKIEEAALTGESVPVDKELAPIMAEQVVLNDMKNLAFSGSFVVYGRGEGIVVGTGMNTEVGKIAQMIMTETDEMTPLQKNIQKTSKYITIGILAIAAITFITGIMTGKEVIDMFLMSISLAVAAIPEGLPAIITIVLAIGVTAMAKENAIIKKLSAVETLGCTEIICTDKTGTLTQNKMTITNVYLPGDKEADDRFLEQMVLCNDSKLSIENGEPATIGDPTENALVNYGFYKGKDKNDLEKKYPRVHELPFDSDRKMMTVVNTYDSVNAAVVKGAPDILLSKCTQIKTEQGVVPMTEAFINEIESANKKMASQALRVLALATKTVEDNVTDKTSETLETDLTFLGLMGMIDPPRQEVKGAVAHCKVAGITTVMITGDHRDTAFAIAKELGIAEREDQVITGIELNNISDEAFAERVTHFRVYARVSPEHKLKIVKAWKKRGKIVAMTGDGVNDAPALKVSDIGIGMGITGTDVTKSVSNMILQDDNFATIVVAVEEGRHIYGNITKAIQFLLSCNIGEVITVFVATLMGWTALLPVHILWVNLVTDSLPALALGVDKTNLSVMKDKPRQSSDSIFAGLVGKSIIYQGILEGLLVLGVYYYGHVNYDAITASTMAFASLGLIQLAHSLNVRSNSKSIFKTGIFNNKYLMGAIAIASILQVLPIVVKPLNEVFKVTQLNGVQWGIVLAASLSIVAIVEVIKLFIKDK